MGIAGGSWTRPRLAERLLLLLSRDPRLGAYHPAAPEGSGDALALLRRSFPGRLDDLAGLQVLDFGCGSGAQVVALARSGPAHVIGVETAPRAVAEAKRRAKAAGVAERVEILPTIRSEDEGRFDLVVSQNAMEHFREPLAALTAMKRSLAPRGIVVLVFGPPWYAPYGGHMYFFTRLPWVSLLFSERTVMSVRSRFRDDGFTRYADLEQGLNRMSVAKFERLVADSGLVFIDRRDEYTWNQRWLGTRPLLRELLTRQVSCVLARPVERAR